MAELEERTGVPRTTIHFWSRERLLPDAEKPAPNAAYYDQRHIRRIRLLDRLRRPPLGPLPLPLVRRVVQLVELGIELESAVSLERSVLGSLPNDLPASSLTSRELAEEAGVTPAFVEEMQEVLLLVPPPGSPATWDALDLLLVRTCAALVRGTGLPLEAARRISETIRALSRYEMELRNRAVQGADDGAAAELTGRIQAGVNLIHGYLFYRWRLHDIAELGAGLLPNEEER